MKKLIYLEDALDSVQKERDFLVKRGQIGAEHILTKHAYDVIAELPSAEPTYQRMPDACRACSNNPQNGGSGICHCTLGQIPIT